MTSKHSRKPAATKRATHSVRGQWQQVTFRVRFTSDYLIKGTDHLELIVITPKQAPLPITETGYLSHFITDKTVPDAKAARAFFLDWIEREAKTRRWQKADLQRRQLNMFALLDSKPVLKRRKQFSPA